MKKGRILIFVFFAFFLISILPARLTGPDRPVVSAYYGDAWWSGDYQYRQGFNASSASSTLSEVVEIWIYRSAGSSSGNICYVGTKCESDYDDIRFTTDGGSPALMNYWIEHQNSSMARIWVKLTSVDSDGEGYFVYYGYSSAAAASTTSVLQYGVEDFEDGDVTGWNYDSSAFSASSTTAMFGTYSGKLADNADNDVSAWECIDYTTATTPEENVKVVFYYNTYWLNDEDSAMEAYWFESYAWDDSASSYVDRDKWTIGWDDSNTAETNYYMFQGTLTSSGIDDKSYIGTYISVYDTDSPSDETWCRYEATLNYDVLSAAIDDDLYIEFGIVGRDTSGVNDINIYVDHIFTYVYHEAKTIDAWESEEEYNNAPTIETAGYCTNPTASVSLYPRYTKYTFSTTVDDADGISEIDMVLLSLVSGAMTVWKVAYDHQTTTFSEVSGGTEIELVTGDCGTTVTGEGYLEVNFVLWIELAATEGSGYGVFVEVNDTSDASDDGLNEVNYNVWTTLDFSIHKLEDGSGTLDRGNIDGSITASFDIHYFGDVSDACYANHSAYDVWVICADIASSPWEIDTWNQNDGTGSTTVYADDVVTGSPNTYTFKAVAEGAGSGGTDLAHTTHTDTYKADQVIVNITAPTYTHIGVGQNLTGVVYSALYDYDDTAFDGSLTWSTAWIKTSATSVVVDVSSVSGGTHVVTSLSTSGSFTAYWENVTYTWSDIWTKYTETQYYDHITISSLKWSSGTNVQNDALVYINRNGTLFGFIHTSSSLAQFAIGFTSAWRYVNYSCYITYTGGSYNITDMYFIKTQLVDVPDMHTIYRDTWDMDWTDLYLYITYDTNWHNSTLSIWWNTTTLLDHFSSEGSCQITLPTVAGLYMIDILINGTGSGYTNDGSYPTNDGWIWLHYNYTVSVTATTMYIVYRMADGTPLDFATFKTYINGYRLPPYSPYYTTTATTVNLTIVDIWNGSVYQDLTFTVANYVDIITSSYWLSLQNQQPWAVNITVEHNLHNVTYYVGPYGSVTFIVYAGSYEVWWVRSDNNELIQHDETFTISSNFQVYTEYLPPEALHGGGGIDEGILIRTYSLWGIAIIFSVIGGVVIYPEIKQRWAAA